MPHDATQPHLTVTEAIRARRSIRAFLPTEVPEATLREIFEVAQLSPSNCNVQPWIPHVVSGALCDALRADLLEAGKTPEKAIPDWPFEGKYDGVYKDRQYDAAARLYAAMGVERTDRAAREAAALRNFSFFGAPHVAFIFTARPFDYRGVTDCGIYVQTLMLAMLERGVESCAQGALALFPQVVRNRLGVSDEYRLLFGISFGYEDKASRVNRMELGREVLDRAVQFHR